MSDEQSALDVAEDYRQALEDLSSTNRADISTLTTIARENTEHAQVITDVLQKHILRTPAHKKLPAIYVLDSIVKNVGTPYTLFFGASLYQTYMEAYAAVDSQVRRKMEETLQTWKQPVPQSLDDRPVFPPEVTKPIEESLLKARSSAMAIQRQTYPLGRGRGPVPPRATPTPPGMRPGSTQAGFPGPPAQMPQMNGSRPPSAAPGRPPSNLHSAQQQYGAQGGMTHSPHQQAPSQFPAPSVDTVSLMRDIQELINASKVEVSQNPNDQSVHSRLKGLVDLQTLLQTQNVPQDQLVLVKNQVADLAVKVRPYSGQSSARAPASSSSSSSAAAATAAATAVSYQTQHPAVSTTPVAPSPSTAPVQQLGSVTLDSLLGQGALASLLSRHSATPQVPTPPPPHQPPAQHQQAEPPRQPSAAPAADPMALLAGLRMAGLLGGGAAPPAVPTLPQVPISPVGLPPPPPGMPGPPPGLLPAGLASLLASTKSAGAISIQGRLMDSIQLDAASLKHEYRPHLIPSLFDALGPQCSQCGRRFAKDEEGKKKKTAHMDWHFQVHHRLAEAERRGQHRSWYVDLADWLKSREAVDADHAKDAAGAEGEDGGAAQKKKEAGPQYIAVPDASAGVNSVCPICQEKFENKWLDTAQEWVWLDTMLVGNRAYHISCHAEATRARDSTPARSTPEPVLGKRKAEDELKNLRKLKMDA